MGFENRIKVNIKHLTIRQIEYLSLVSLGLNNFEISNTLFISLNTVKMTLKIIFDKLRVNNRTSAVTFAFIKGVLTFDIISYVIRKYKLEDKINTKIEILDRVDETGEEIKEENEKKKEIIKQDKPKRQKKYIR